MCEIGTDWWRRGKSVRCGRPAGEDAVHNILCLMASSTLDVSSIELVQCGEALADVSAGDSVTPTAAVALPITGTATLG